MLKKLRNILEAEIDPAFAKRAEYILSEIEKERPGKILDAGCGRGFYLKCLSFYPFIREVHGVDLNNKYLSAAKKLCNDKRTVLKNSSMYSLPYPDSYFDLIIASEIIEHLKDDDKGVRELKRVLKPKGTLIITVPNFDFPFFWDPINWVLMRCFKTHMNKDIWWLAGIWADHERLYKEDELVKFVKRTGFKVTRVKKYIRWSWPFSHFLLYGIGKNLVEKLPLGEFNRFNFNPKTFSTLLAKLFSLPSRLDRNLRETSVGIFLTTHK